MGSHVRRYSAEVVALTVNSRDEVLQGAAVKRESSGPLSLLVLLDGLQDQLFLKSEAGNRNWHHWMKMATALHYLCMHACMRPCMKAHVGQAWAQPCQHMCSGSHTHTLFVVIKTGHTPARISFPSSSLTAFARLSALGMCSKSTKGWVKNSAKVIRASGFLSSSRSRRSLQSLDTLAPGGSWCTKHDLIMFHSVHRTIQREKDSKLLPETF